MIAKLRKSACSQCILHGLMYDGYKCWLMGSAPKGCPMRTLRWPSAATEVRKDREYVGIILTKKDIGMDPANPPKIGGGK